MTSAGADGASSAAARSASFGATRVPVVERRLQRRRDAGHELAAREIAADDGQPAVTSAALERRQLHFAPFQLST